MDRVRTAGVIGVVTGLVGVLLSFVAPIASLEDTLGLRWLFLARGPVSPPPGVVVVSIDETAAAHLSLPSRVRDWPRAYHARLVDQLVQLGASVIAFDLQFFRDGAAADDAELAAAIDRSKRVVLVQKLERVAVSPQEIWRRQDPIPTFVAAAAGLAPVPIPYTPVVSWFWSFLPTTAGAVPTLPAIALQVASARIAPALSEAFRAAGLDAAIQQPAAASDIPLYMRELRGRLRGHASQLAAAMEHVDATPNLDAEDRQLARAVVGLYAGDDATYLNFYGPPGSICTAPYERVLEGSSQCPIKGAMVFVGVGRSRLAQAEQIDTYHTIYERTDRLDFSGIELHATAFANLLTRTGLRPVGPSTSLAILLGGGIILGAAGYWIRTRRRRRGGAGARLEAAIVVVTVMGAYGVAVYILFARSHVTVPLIVPLAAQLPTALILGILARPVVREERLRAVCVVADAGGSTAVGQRLPHGAYASLMTDYNRALVGCVTARGGLTLPPHGDGFVSLWLLDANDDMSVRRAACQAALAMVAAADRFNSVRAKDEQLPLRLGLTIGDVTLRSDADRGMLEAVGDAVNVASRLQELNKELSTRVLTTAAVTNGIEGSFGLNLIPGEVTLRGVIAPPRVFEIIGTQAIDV